MSNHGVHVEKANLLSEIRHGDLMLRHELAPLLTEPRGDLVLKGLVLGALLRGERPDLAAIEQADEDRGFD
eukprot:1226610-Heterocapsa_arctica.AAC.1